MYQNATNTRRGSQGGTQHWQSQQYCVTHNFDGPAKLSETVIHAISGAANVDVSKVEKTVREQIDPYALDHLFRPTDGQYPHGNGQLTIPAFGHTVTIYGDGQVIISPQPVQK